MVPHCPQKREESKGETTAENFPTEPHKSTDQRCSVETKQSKCNENPI